MQGDLGSQRSFSVLDRLLHTHPVWLQLSINADSALYILLREPVGTFLVRKCSSSQRKLLCVRVTADRAASSIKECLICEEDSTFALESSALSFPDLCRLVAFYCISRDVLPFPLELPEAIAQASTHRKLEAISHMGLEFWSSLSDTQNGPGDLQAPPTIKASPITTKTPPTSAMQVKAGLSQDLCYLLSRGRQESLCFINPLFLQLEQQQQPQQSIPGASHKRHRFKRSMRVRVSTESSMTLSGCGGGGGGAGSFPLPPPENPKDQERLQPTPLQPSPKPHRKVHPGAGVLRKTPALSPMSAEDEDLVPVPPAAPTDPPVGEVEEDPSAPEEPSIEEACLALEGHPAPSLAQLDSSSSFSSLEEEDTGAEAEDQFFKQPNPNPQHRPPLVRSRGGHGGLQRMSAAFVCFFAPEKRLARLVEELSRERRSAFGSLVQEFLQKQKEELRGVLTQADSSSSFSSPKSSLVVLQGLRCFLSQAKSFLLDSGELSPPLETLVPENEKAIALEKAMFGCVLKPLRVLLDQALLSLHRQDGSTQHLASSLLACQEGAMERLGVLVGVPDTRGVERVRQKLGLMQRTHSPIDKVLLLLQVCKSVQKAMGALHDGGQEVSSEDFLPALSYVIVMCNTPQILLEVEYMMELLEPSWLTGEGGYYLTSVYASLCLIQSPEAKGDQVPPGGLTREALDGLREWGRRRSLEAKSNRERQQNQRCVRVLFQDGERSAVRTLQWRAGESCEALARLCASTFGVSEPQDYTLYWRSGGEMRTLPTQTQPQDLASHSEGGPSLSYLRTDHDFSKMRRLTRGGAVDLGESVCEE
ncbi:ras and Rab interactor 2 isoform X1 [Oncorhynchus keta]|uniref:ras and Rab interactor 2 isoform X1 n=1 Tax=Oncorhynchus keta TaxID=8018 RepID=UPI00227D1B68|nr:ras and Rab interactor 2 isoform X1 [Oncorhynchus keta]XP_052353332.1 ras and Rab interactor 2 isoform X1 [Oncorhynchus keta]